MNILKLTIFNNNSLFVCKTTGHQYVADRQNLINLQNKSNRENIENLWT